MTSATMSPLSGNTRETKVVASISMVLVLVSFSMLFATLFLGYVALRFTAPVWPPMGMTDLPVGLAAISTTFVILSSMTWFVFEKSFKPLWVWLTFILGNAFMASQFVLWSDLKSRGIFADTGVFASIIYAFTWIHAAHIVAALILVMWPMVWATKGSLVDARIIKTESIGKFWHFLTIVWILMFISLFLF